MRTYVRSNFYKGAQVLDSSLLMAEVNLDMLDVKQVKIFLKPCLEDVELVIEIYNEFHELVSIKSLKYFTLNCHYDNEHDRIEIQIINGFDWLIFNICAMLNIGRITFFEDLEPDDNKFTIDETFVSSIVLTLEEFKLLDGFVGEFDISGDSIDFKGMRMSNKSISESVCDDFVRADGKKEYMLRGEKLFKWID